MLERRRLEGAQTGKVSVSGLCRGCSYRAGCIVKDNDSSKGVWAAGVLFRVSLFLFHVAYRYMLLKLFSAERNCNKTPSMMLLIQSSMSTLKTGRSRCHSSEML